MDEVLASLQRGQLQLRKAPTHKTAPPAEDARSNLMSAIRQGVILKKVRHEGVEHATFFKQMVKLLLELSLQMNFMFKSG